MDYLYFSDITKKYEELKKEDFEKYIKNNILVKKYIGIVKKYAILEMFNENFTQNILSKEIGFEVEEVLFSYDMQLLFEIILSYTNILMSEEEKTVENYDFIKANMIYDYIYDICQRDVDLFIKRCDEVVGINNIRFYLDIVSKMDNFKFDDIHIDEILNSLDDDKIKIIKNINKYNNQYVDTLLKNKAIQ